MRQVNVKEKRDMRTPRVCVRLASIKFHVDFLYPNFSERNIYKRW